MVGTYLAEYAITYKPISHGRAGIGGEKFVSVEVILKNDIYTRMCSFYSHSFVASLFD